MAFSIHLTAIRGEIGLENRAHQFRTNPNVVPSLLVLRFAFRVQREITYREGDMCVCVCLCLRFIQTMKIRLVAVKINKNMFWLLNLCALMEDN